jgi:tRNA pseudouridine55 synthase
MTDGVLIVDKPEGPTSHDVVGRVRRILRTRSVGHAGTLDPMATGVLVLGVGEGTKLLHHLTGAEKAYVARLRLGAQTDSLDAQGSVIATAEVPAGLTRERVEQVALQFVGALRQRVPEISAVKVDGERLYARARRGDVVDAPERDVVVHVLEILRVELPEIELRVRASKGFYVRSLARDLSLALGSVGHLTALRRTHSGSFSIADAAPGELLRADLELAREQLRARMLPLAAALRDQPRCTLSEQGLVEVRHGRVVRPEHTLRCDALQPGQQPVALLDEQGQLRALGRAEEGHIVVIRGMSQA